MIYLLNTHNLKRLFTIFIHLERTQKIHVSAGIPGETYRCESLFEDHPFFFSSKEISAPFFKLPTKSIRPRFLTAKKKILAPLFLNAAQVSHKFWKVPNEEVSGIVP